MWPKEMTDDITLKAAADDSPVVLKVYASDYWQKWVFFTVAVVVSYLAILVVNLVPAAAANVAAKRLGKPGFHVSVIRYLLYGLPIPLFFLGVAIIGQVAGISVIIFGLIPALFIGISWAGFAASHAAHLGLGMLRGRL